MDRTGTRAQECAGRNCPSWRYLSIPYTEDPLLSHENLLLDLGRPDAWQYAFEQISDKVSSLHLTWYRQDCNIVPLPYWRGVDTPDWRGMYEIHHIMGLYRLWNAPRVRFPGLMIDNCASGGRRIDIVTMRRAILLWRSNAQCPATP